HARTPGRRANPARPPCTPGRRRTRHGRGPIEASRPVRRCVVAWDHYQESLMRFPLSLTTTMVGYMARKKLSGVKRFPLVLMLEPLHACNLTCTGCGRIREYSDTIKDKLSVEECLASVDEAGAPIVSICGGEPLIYPEIGRLVKGILKKRKHIYLCTNGMFIKKRLHEFRPT